MAKFPSLTFIVDGTERPVRRPKHGIRRKALYSGRKKRHAVKNIIAVRDRRVVLLGKTRPGSWHDKKCIDREKWAFPHGSNVLADSGFAGYTQPDSKVITPKRKPHRRKPYYGGIDLGGNTGYVWSEGMWYTAGIAIGAGLDNYGDGIGNNGHIYMGGVDQGSSTGWCQNPWAYLVNGEVTTLDGAGNGTWNGFTYLNGVKQ